MLDEFPMLGRLDVLAEALSLIAGYGIRACLVAQDLTQIYAAYGHDEAVTVNCDTSVAFTPNKIRPPRRSRRLAGETTCASCAPDGIQCGSQRVGTGSGPPADDAGRGPAACAPMKC